jgi:hypothetical protein
MSKPDEGRRAFLIGAAVGAGAAAGLVPDAIAQTHPPRRCCWSRGPECNSIN